MGTIFRSTICYCSTDIIPIVNYAWNNSFSRIRQNKKAIAERGWFPYNRALLNHEEIRAGISAHEAETDKFLGADVTLESPSQQTVTSTLTPDSSSSCGQDIQLSRNMTQDVKKLTFKKL